MHRSIRRAAVAAVTVAATLAIAPSAEASNVVTVKDAKGDTSNAKGASKLDISKLVVRRKGETVIATLQVADLTEKNTSNYTYEDPDGFTFTGPSSSSTVYFDSRNRQWAASYDTLQSTTGGRDCAIRSKLDLQADTVRYKVPVSCFGKVKQVTVAGFTHVGVKGTMPLADGTKFSKDSIRVS